MELQLSYPICICRNQSQASNMKYFFHPQECPSGVVNEETFKHIYAQFFPHGGTCKAKSLNITCGYISGKCLMFSFAVPDASTYAHYLFNAFDTGNNGSIKFEVWRLWACVQFWHSLKIYVLVTLHTGIISSLCLSGLCDGTIYSTAGDSQR